MLKPNLSKLTTRSAFFLLVGLFALLFVLRTSYVLWVEEGRNYADGSTVIASDEGGSVFQNQSVLRKNYASEKKLEAAPSPGVQGESSQKYEKTATLNARSENFESEESKLRKTTKDFNAIIQYEQRVGNPGNRALHLVIGVRPELFDSFYVATQKIGRIYFNSVIKVDKTTEFRELNAKKASLEKALASLTELKNHAGSISDLVGLHDKILDIERQMQELGVELGNFSAENEFCTLRFSLFENPAARAVPLARILFEAFVWTIQYYLMLLLGLGGALIAAFVSVALIKRLGDSEKKE